MPNQIKTIVAASCLCVCSMLWAGGQVVEDPVAGPAIEAPAARPVTADPFGLPRTEPVPDLERRDRFEPAAEAPSFFDERTHVDRRQMLPAFKPIGIRVLKDGQPVEGALVVGYLGYPVAVREGTDGTLSAHVAPSGLLAEDRSQSNGAPRFWQSRTNSEGLIQLGRRAWTATGQPVLAIHKDLGYATAVLSEQYGNCEVNLQSFSGLMGAWAFSGHEAAATHFEARWESFPHAPALRGLPLKERIKGPGLFSITRRVVNSANDDFATTAGVPAGRLHITLATTASDNRSVPTNIHWWQTVNPGNNQLTLPDTTPAIVTGQVNLTDEILERVTRVSRDRDGRITAYRNSLIIRIEAGSPFDELAAAEIDQGVMTLEKAVRKAIVWGRSGGRRESGDSQNLAVLLDEDGRFSAMVSNAGFAVTGLWSLAGRMTGKDGLQPEDFTQTQIAYVSDAAHGTIEPAENRVPVMELGLLNLTMVDETVGAEADDVFAAATYDGDRQGELRSPEGGETGAQDDFPRSPSPDPAFSDRLRQPDVLQPDVPVPTASDPFSDDLGFPPEDSVDRSISQLITRILSAGDQKTRENLRAPLQKLLTQKFDAEQNAREQLVEELTKRLNEASKKVQERARRRDEIIGQQVQRMLGLPLDDFQPVPGNDALLPADMHLEPQPVDADTLPRGRSSNFEPFPRDPTNETADDFSSF